MADIAPRGIRTVLRRPDHENAIGVAAQNNCGGFPITTTVLMMIYPKQLLTAFRLHRWFYRLALFLVCIVLPFVDPTLMRSTGFGLVRRHAID